MIALREAYTERGSKCHLSWGVGFLRTLCGSVKRGLDGAQVKAGEGWGTLETECVRCAAAYRKIEREIR